MGLQLSSESTNIANISEFEIAFDFYSNGHFESKIPLRKPIPPKAYFFVVNLSRKFFFYFLPGFEAQVQLIAEQRFQFGGGRSLCGPHGLQPLRPAPALHRERPVPGVQQCQRGRLHSLHWDRE